MAELSDLISEYLKKNSDAEDPISAGEIATIFTTNTSAVRHAVNAARAKGVPVCSCRVGYYYSEDEEHINRTIASLTRRALKMSHAIDGLAGFVEGGIT